MNNDMVVALFVAVPILLLQGTLLFLDARRQGVNPWFWGIAGLIHCPGGALLYWLVVYKPFRRKRT